MTHLVLALFLSSAYHITSLSLTLSSQQDAGSSNNTLGNNDSTFHRGSYLHGVPHAAVSLLCQLMSKHEAQYINIHYPYITHNHTGILKISFPPKLSQHYKPCSFYIQIVGLMCPASSSQNAVYFTWVTLL